MYVCVCVCVVSRSLSLLRDPSYYLPIRPWCGLAPYNLQLGQRPGTDQSLQANSLSQATNPPPLPGPENATFHLDSLNAANRLILPFPSHTCSPSLFRLDLLVLQTVYYLPIYLPTWVRGSRKNCNVRCIARAPASRLHLGLQLHGIEEPAGRHFTCASPLVELGISCAAATLFYYFPLYESKLQRPPDHLLETPRCGTRHTTTQPCTFCPSSSTTSVRSLPIDST